MVLIRLISAVVFLGLASPCLADTIRVFAAASLRDVLEEAAQHMPDDQILFSYAGSSAIARQVANGAPADVVILANTDWMDWLVTQQHITSEQVIELASNRLVLMGGTDAPPIPDPTAAVLLERLNNGRLAIGQTQSVPAGIYARQWLENAGLWDALAPHLAETDNVRAALALVARGEAPLGVVYASDAMTMPSLNVVYDIPQALHSPIRYPMAVMRDTPAPRAFADFLRTDQGQTLFKAHGFLSIGDGS